MVYGSGTRAVPVTTTCTRSTGTRHSMGLWSRCTLRWPLVTELGFPAFRSSRQLLSQQSCARERAQSNSITRRLSSPSCSGKLGHLLENSRPHTRLPSQTYSCNLYLCLSSDCRFLKLLMVSIYRETAWTSSLSCHVPGFPQILKIALKFLVTVEWASFFCVRCLVHNMADFFIQYGILFEQGCPPILHVAILSKERKEKGSEILRSPLW